MEGWLGFATVANLLNTVGFIFLSFLLSENSKAVNFLLLHLIWSKIIPPRARPTLVVCCTLVFIFSNFLVVLQINPSKLSKTYLLNARWTPKHEKFLVNLDDVVSLSIVFKAAKLYVE